MSKTDDVNNTVPEAKPSDDDAGVGFFARCVRRFRNHWKASAFGQKIAICLAFVGAGIFCWHVTTYVLSQLDGSATPPVSTEASLPPSLLEMEKRPSDWMKNPKDFSFFMADLQRHNVSALGLARDMFFISTVDGTKYLVRDRGGEMVRRIVTDFMRDGAPSPFVMGAIKTPEPESSVIGMVFMIFFQYGLQLIVSVLMIFLLVSLVLRSSSNGPKVSKPTGISFDDVIGVQEAKAAFSDIVEYLKNHESYANSGVRPPRGVLLSGPPGVGKTLLAKALAGECGVNFIPVTGSHFTSMFYGAGVDKVKALFALARKKAPAIIFCDEIDGIGSRVQGGSSADAEFNRIINQVLAEMDGFEPEEGIVVIGATNYADSLDEALLREGRFDRKIHVSLPGLEDRSELFRYYLSKVENVGEMDFMQLARLSTGMSPATIAHIVNQAAFKAMKGRAAHLEMSHIKDCIETNRMGAEQNPNTPALDAEDRRRIAVHEAGHAVISAALNVGCLEKVTILPRGSALGVTMMSPLKETSLQLKSDLDGRIQMLLGGRVAERLVLGQVSSGASHDLQEASRIAFNMVARYGMSDDQSLFSADALPGHSMAKDHNDYVRKANALLESLNVSCVLKMTELRAALDSVTDSLLEHETIAGDVVRDAVHAAMVVAPATLDAGVS